MVVAKALQEIGLKIISSDRNDNWNEGFIDHKSVVKIFNCVRSSQV